MDKLKSDLKTKGLSDGTIKVYIGNLRMLNDKQDFDSLNFLVDTTKIMNIINNLKTETTKKNYLVTIVSVLKDYKESEMFKKAYETYYNEMLKFKKSVEKFNETHELTETQNENWMDWDEIKSKYESLKTDANAIYKKKIVNENDYKTLLCYALLSLYVLVPPRRNKDYTLMKVVDEFTDELDQKFNYYDLKHKKFIFQNYKTSKKYGRFDFSVPITLQRALNKYLKHRDTRLPLDNLNNQYMLMNYDGEPLNKSSDITKLLNHVFGKKIGSSMLRHIYITDKFENEVSKQNKVASEMAHSPQEQKLYIKKRLPKTMN